jgi:hypothetical protein
MVFSEHTLASTPIRDLGLKLEGTPIERTVEKLIEEIRAAGLTKLTPRVYLSTEWGVPFDTVAIAVPFYLASPELTRIHAERAGHVEGADADDVMRYLRHEMGHVVNYAYKLYADPEWRRLFGDITAPYEDDYRPIPFSRRFVRHLPGWYAQKHPDEDWAETFAVWMTPGLDWRREYAGWPALAKLEWAERRLRELGDRDPSVTDVDFDDDVGDLASTLEQFYRDSTPPTEDVPNLDEPLVALFNDAASRSSTPSSPAADLIRRVEPDLVSSVFRWTGHFPERTLSLMRHLARRAEDLQLRYDPAREPAVTMALTTLVTALAMSFVQRGSYWG